MSYTHGRLAEKEGETRERGSKRENVKRGGKIQDESRQMERRREILFYEDFCFRIMHAY